MMMLVSAGLFLKHYLTRGCHGACKQRPDYPIDPSIKSSISAESGNFKAKDWSQLKSTGKLSKFQNDWEKCVRRQPSEWRLTEYWVNKIAIDRTGKRPVSAPTFVDIMRSTSRIISDRK
eukprot:TRINITY_DN25370_c0_g1_i1.p1 TRINITY_DN25370_c0_g1~~TRINITY_DN25370_c0_g1_i1.p1  ORF type:complete len:119 (-),score=1.74 TRINITY_DN25370_c0_g1_i1:230-586(-)